MNTVVYHVLNPPIRARYIRVVPVDWHNWISMRMELYGCQGNERVLFSALIPRRFVHKIIAIHVLRVRSSDDINITHSLILIELMRTLEAGMILIYQLENF